MIDRQKTKPGRSGERGAALIVAIAIMTILLAVALTFYAISRDEVQRAVNVRNQMQNELSVDGVVAMVQADLNRNFMRYPNATSLDMAPFTVYDGSAWVGKEWALRNDPVEGRVPLQGIDTDGNLLPDTPGVPLVDLSAMPVIEYPDNFVEQMFNGPRSRDWLTIPRYENTGTGPFAYADNVRDFSTGTLYPWIFNLADRNRPRFVTPGFFGPSDTRNELAALDPRLQGNVERYPLEWIDTWTDVDNDGDGLKDAIWIPIPQDRFFSGGEVLDETIDARLYDDGIDNDLDLTGRLGYDEHPEANEGAMELGTFVYNGRADGLDNDGDGAVDEADENKLFLTAPLPGLVIPLDYNADGKVPDYVPNATGTDLTMITVTLPATINVQTAGGVVPLTIADVDKIDNDYDMLINDYQVYAYVGPNPLLGPPFRLRGFEKSGEVYPPTHPLAGQPIIVPQEDVSADNSLDSSFGTAKLKSYELINDRVFPTAPNVLPDRGIYYLPDRSGTTVNLVFDDIEPYIRITSSGEPACDLAGRAAITVRDESSKVNVNVAGAHNYDPLADDTLRSLGDGASTAEVETRNLPDIGLVRARDIWSYRTGAPEGALVPGFEADTALPGYGRVDDNANALISAFNGKDDDGDGLIDEGIYLPPISPMAERFLAGTSLPADNVTAAGIELNNTRYREYFNQLGAFEGVDEPAELQRFNPLPNLVAEGNNPFKVSALPVDNLDNDLDGVVNERGELGDLQLQDPLQLGEVSDIGTNVRRDRLMPLTTTFSVDRNVNFVSGRDGIKAINKLDYNFATPVQIAGNLLLANPFESVTARPVAPLAFNTPANPLHLAVNRFAEGLRQSDVHIRAGFGGLMNGTVTYFAADPVLQTLQAAVDIVDNRDRDNHRSLLTTEKTKVSASLGGYDFFPERLTMRERIADGELMPLGELEDHLRNDMTINRKLEIRDDWWTFEAGVVGANGNPEVREISYTASGNEAIKINEVMVRPVRRIEAEAVTGPMPASDPMLNPAVTAVAPLTNFDPSPFDAGGNPSITPQFDVVRSTAPGVVNGWQLVNGGFLGEKSAMNITLDTSVAQSILDASDILQFTIRATDGLPPGRYYLTLNTNNVLGQPTVVPAPVPMLQAAVKYRDSTSGGQAGDDIITDVANAIDFFAPIPNQRLAGSIPGAPVGWAFVDGTQSGLGFAAGYHGDGLPAHPGLPGFGPFPSTQSAPAVQTFTVTVPPVGSIYELQIAVRLNPTFVGAVSTTGLTYNVSINSLDFSQEPDHEWLELVNTSDETVNIGNWELEVGIPDRPAIPNDPFKSRWKIPQGTEVAPRGMVLLAFSKFDRFQDSPAAERIADNGMGLADGAPIALLGNLVTGNLTVPPIADNSAITTQTTLPNYLFDPTGSVFRRLINPISGQTDYMDADGDGRSGYNVGTSITSGLDNLVNDVSVASSKELGTLTTTARGDLPWDRIIQLDEMSLLTTNNPFTASPSAKRLLDVTTVNDVAALVLRGGVFPNYPEQDGHDNDGDGGYVLFNQVDLRTQVSGGPYDVGTPGGDGIPDWIDSSQVPGIPTQYIPGTLDMDMVDNDFDGFVDERPYQGGLLAPGVFSSFYHASLSEGVDEGAGLYGNALAARRFGAGSFELNVLPLSVFPDRQAWTNAYLAGIPNLVAVDTTLSNPAFLQYGINTGFNIYGDPAIIPAAIPTAYQGSDNDPADWKSFSERRWYPGDDVIITLYEGQALDNAVADRVTYNQYDVTNRTIDDIAPVPYIAVDLGDPGTTAGDNIYELPGINPAYPSMWLPNSMGLDFYRSLERKHPLYNGDRFGTTNRWEATDGNYDDWSDSLSFFEADLGTASPLPLGATEAVTLASNTITDIRPRFTAHPAFPNTDVATLARNNQLYGHAIYGTPLRTNREARRAEQLPDLELALGTYTSDYRDNPFNYFRTHEDGIYNAADAPKNGIRIPGEATSNTKSLADQSWNISRAFVANRPFETPGDLMRVPHMVYLQDAINTTAGSHFLRDRSLANINVQGDSGISDGRSYIQDIALRSATLGQDSVDEQFSPNLLSAAVASMAQDSLVLTMGQAEFRPILPLAADVGATPSLVEWIPNTAGGSSVDDLLAPAAWAPVFLFGLGTDGPRTNLEQFPNYPPYVNGSNAGVVFEPHYLFNGAYLADNGNFGGVDAYNNDPEDRWPLETRTAMYVTENRGGGVARAEALFTWDASDGLENGEYVVYIGTYVPGMREELEDAAVSAARTVNSPAPINMVSKNTPGLLNPADTTLGFTSLTLEDLSTLTFQDGTPVPVGRVANSILLRDPSNPRRANRHFDPVYAIDVITDPSEARGQAAPSGGASKPAGLIDPADWNPAIQYKPGPDGYIFYGNNAAGGWKPQIVRVTDNFLALRVRNMGEPGQVAALTHVVLAPRKRTAGRINVNTVQSRVVNVGTSQEYASTLMSLPGIVDVARTVIPSVGGGVGFVAGPIPPTSNVSTPTNNALPPVNSLTGLTPWTPPSQQPSAPPEYFLAGETAVPERNRFNETTGTDSDLLVPLGLPDDATDHLVGSFRMNAGLMAGRTEHAEGRYYPSLGALLSDSSAFDYNYAASRADIPDRTGLATEGVEDYAIYPLSNDANPAKRFDEIQARFRRLGNSATTRSDVFEITMTVESGYGVDANGDGFFNYRDPREFVTSAATKATAVYERRAPSDTSDSAE